MTNRGKSRCWLQLIPIFSKSNSKSMSKYIMLHEFLYAFRICIMTYFYLLNLSKQDKLITSQENNNIESSSFVVYTALEARTIKDSKSRSMIMTTWSRPSNLYMYKKERITKINHSRNYCTLTDNVSFRSKNSSPGHLHSQSS